MPGINYEILIMRFCYRFIDEKSCVWDGSRLWLINDGSTASKLQWAAWEAPWIRLLSRRIAPLGTTCLGLAVVGVRF